MNLRHDFDDKKIPDFQTDVFDAGPREFLYLLANASLVMTNSFHGTIFSINFNVPFVSILNRISETNSRIISILTILGLKDRIMYDDDKRIPQDILSLDFDRCNASLAKLRDSSIDFLTKNLR